MMHCTRRFNFAAVHESGPGTKRRRPRRRIYVGFWESSGSAWKDGLGCLRWGNDLYVGRSFPRRRRLNCARAVARRNRTHDRLLYGLAPISSLRTADGIVWQGVNW